MSSTNSRAIQTPPPRPVPRVGDLTATWLIARRGALESLHDTMTVAVSSVFALAVPLALVVAVLLPFAEKREDVGSLGMAISTYLLVVGLMPSTGSIGVASGMFAGEKEKGSLLPLLASPASNRAIFAGKILGAVLPSLLFAAIAELSYLVEISLIFGLPAWRLLPIPLSIALLALIPANAVLGAAVASLVSSRVGTYQSAQMIAGLAVVPFTGALFALAFQMQSWGPALLVGAVAGLFALDLVLIAISAATWRREEVMAKR
jgi:ABC-type Na+ efflux pump permease subunit